MKLKNLVIFTLLSVLLSLSACMSYYIPSEEEKALVNAVLYQDQDGLETLLQNGVTPDARAVSGETALTVALKNYYLESAELLLTYGANINQQDSMGATALFYATKPVIQQWLIDRGIDIFIVSDHYQMNAFEVWCANQAILLTEAQKNQTMDILSSQGIETTRGFMEEKFWLSRNDLVETISLYQEAGYDLSTACNEEGNTPLVLAAYGENYPLLEALLSAGADPQIKNNYGDHVLAILAGRNFQSRTDVEFRSVTTALIAHGADINAIDINGNTALCNATASGFRGRVGILLAIENCNVNAPGEFGESPLFKSSSLGIVQDLVAAGADIEMETHTGNTPLFILTDTDSVQYLINRGANIHHINNDRENILVHNMKAAEKSYHFSYDYEGIQNRFIGKVAALLDAGIEVNYDAGTNDTALYYASRVPFEGIVSLLIQAGAR